MAQPNGIPQLSDAEVDLYLARLGIRERPKKADLATLGRLHVAHLERIPFENLDIHIGQRIALDFEEFFNKLVRRNRGGFCYEQNGAFAALLSSLGYDVELREAAVYRPQEDGSLVRGMSFGHMAIVVNLQEGPYLADVGFGRGGFDRPLRLDTQDVQNDTAGSFQLRRESDGNVVFFRNGVQQYVMSAPSRQLAEFGDACHDQQTNPNSPFKRGSICTLRRPNGRVTVAGNKFIVTTSGRRTQTEIAGPTQLGEVLETTFGVHMPDAALTTLYQTAASEALVAGLDAGAASLPPASTGHEPIA